LVKEPRSAAQLAVRLEEGGDPNAGAISVVHVLVDAEVRLHGVDVAAVAGVVPDDSRGRRRAHRNVRGEFEASARAAVADRFAGELGDSLGSADLRLIRDVADRARLRSGTEERPLRTAPDL